MTMMKTMCSALVIVADPALRERVDEVAHNACPEAALHHYDDVTRVSKALLGAEHPASPCALAIVTQGEASEDVWLRALLELRRAGPDLHLLLLANGADRLLERYQVGLEALEPCTVLDRATHGPVLKHHIRNAHRQWCANREHRLDTVRLALADRLARLGHLEWDCDTGDGTWNGTAARLLGSVDESTSGSMQTFVDLLAPADQVRLRQLFSQQDGIADSACVELKLPSVNGQWRSVRLEAARVEDSPSHWLGAVRDITSEHGHEAAMRSFSMLDALTGLPNRAYLLSHLKQQVEHCLACGQRFAILHIGLDGFRRFNETLGHRTGDRLLKDVSDRLKNALRAGDYLARDGFFDPVELGGASAARDSQRIARLNGDEFIVVLPHLREHDDAVAVAERLMRAIREPLDLDGPSISIGASVGIAQFPEDGKSHEALLSAAESALADAKLAGRGRHRFNTRALSTESRRQFEVESALRRALSAWQLELFYQPKISLDSGRVAGAEALLRWNDPVLGQVSPMEFIPIAERSGLIVPLGNWVIEQACLQMRTWKERYLVEMPISVNLSVEQFRDDRLIPLIREALLEHRLDPAELELEITESVVMDDDLTGGSRLSELRTLGVCISLDDFGTGYSSLSRLKVLPIDTIKIDRSFVCDVLNNVEDQAILRTIVNLGQSLALRVVAEGVESEPQLNYLRGLGCDLIQGFVISPAVPAHEFEQRFLDALAVFTEPRQRMKSA
ncbi:MAG: EAL domain-containing protein [Gammaproteobacteria bacterium]|nr:EAL domain-containing protein [Gammaproteobacteria bacterium]